VTRAFTLIELLVAVAIVAILAAIAIPNLLEAQTRSKVSRAQADLRAIHVALETYAVDCGTYPVNQSGLGFTGDLYGLTKPVAYITSLPADIFSPPALYYYAAAARFSPASAERFGEFVLASAGPDAALQTALADSIPYDATNGTVSAGDILRRHKDDGK